MSLAVFASARIGYGGIVYTDKYGLELKHVSAVARIVRERARGGGRSFDIHYAYLTRLSAWHISLDIATYILGPGVFT